VYALSNSGIREEDAERGREEGSECGKNKEIGGSGHKKWEERWKKSERESSKEGAWRRRNEIGIEEDHEGGRSVMHEK
jgi:hypothetical protein